MQDPIPFCCVYLQNSFMNNGYIIYFLPQNQSATRKECVGLIVHYLEDSLVH